MNNITVYTDGSTVGKNGKLGTVEKIGIGYYIPKFEISYSAVEKGISNNVAEIRAMIRALEALLPYKKEAITLYSDSQLAVMWFNKGNRSKKKPHLLQEQHRLYDLIVQFKDIHAEWIPREDNEIADELSNRHIEEILT